ncbi:SHOCT domain-containing protein [Saccharicrinis sp. FJH2]|uniref:SHOCT domain-containing protein n=1 Tax=Saccharicrinis sp. FJH65 TaxID=3344659 RepID=UPI0035F49918
MYGYNGMNWGMGFGWIIGIALMILIIWIIFRTVNGSSGTTVHRSKSAMDILNERYAKGEINDKEYEEKAKRIKQS